MVDMAKSTPSDGPDDLIAVVYDAGERRTHEQHAAESYDAAQRADSLRQLADAIPPGPIPPEDGETWSACVRGYRRASEECRQRAQWHATMALYEVMAPRSLPLDRLSRFTQDERDSIVLGLRCTDGLLLSTPGHNELVRALLNELDHERS